MYKEKKSQHLCKTHIFWGFQLKSKHVAVNLCEITGVTKQGYYAAGKLQHKYKTQTE